jgi:hypothetical protein
LPLIIRFFYSRQCSTERNSELFSLLRNGSERNSESFASIFVPLYGIPSIFLFRGMGSERNAEIFAFGGTGGIPLEETNFSAYSVFRGIIFLSEIANPSVSSHRTKGEGVGAHSPAVKGWGGQYFGRRQTLDWPLTV